MFWRFNNMCTTNIDGLLNDEEVTLQRLMDEDDIIQECKSSNRKLINFLAKSEVLHELVGLVTKEPSNQSPDALRFKYNNTAAELFSCDVSAINDAIVGDESLLAELCDFVYAEPPLNPLMASFFSKAMAVLVGRKADKMLEYLKTKEAFLSRLLKHLRTSAIMDLVLKLVTCVENKNSRLEISQWLCSERFVESLMGLLSGNAEPDLHGNVAQLLCDLLRLLRDMHAQNVAMANEVVNSGAVGDQQQQQAEPVEADPILCSLESKATVDLLLDHMLGGDIGESSIVHGVTVLLTLLEVRRSPQLMTSEPEMFDGTPPDPVVNPCIRNTVEAIIPRLKDFHQILVQPPQKTAPDAALPNGACAKPFGFVRLQVTRLVAALIATGSSEVQKELATLGTITLLFEMMVDYSHNNFLHAQVERCIQHVLGLEPIDLLQPSMTQQPEQSPAEKGDSTPTDGSAEPAGRNEAEHQPTSPNHPLLAHLITETCLVRRIMDAWELNEQHESQPGGVRRAFMGHLIRIANYVVDFGKQGKNVARIGQLINDLPDDLRTQWLEFVETKLAQANRNNEIIPVTSSMVVIRANSDKENSELARHALPRDTAAQELFAEYQIEVMSKHVVAQFGFADTQFHDNDDHLRPAAETLVSINLPCDADELTQQSELFEQVCNERMETRPKGSDVTTSGADAAEGSNDDDETWLQQGRRRSSENTSTVRPESNSDEEETIADDSNDPMDVDALDPWATSADAAVPAVPDVDPWASAPATSASGEQENNEENWANFSKADFDNFCGSTPMEVSDSPFTAGHVTSRETNDSVTLHAVDGSESSSQDQTNGPV